MWDFMNMNMTFFHGFWMVIFWIIIILIILSIFNSGCSRDERREKKEKPLDILKKRLAKGEITKDEFNELKKEIE